jgi:hypothetical protein
MGRPPMGTDGSIYIPLVEVDWNFKWTLTYDTQNSRFVITGADHSVTFNYDTTTFPSWNHTTLDP